ncbi:crotonase/enoyl-CoA hydratase family protein [Rhodobacter sp. SY28-1]|uniref:crotonase/enoyl-CoA hydratase family protein n=1 Tax=Rhodobacter sp. SY28-1 TaxID=2562317 RepID=UPI0010BF6EA4|nr:crotonase/enoyl-CoA hydratase family protein [Rhodobacter sp. SY28-1]
MTADTPILYELRGDIALIGLNREPKRNAISDRVVEALHLAVERAQDEAKAAVLWGEGKHFCAGLDLAEHAEKPLIAAVKGSRRWHRVFDGIERGGIPFVAALQGGVVGGGFELAAAAHVRVADATAFFGLPEGQRGIFVGGGGSVRIARLIGAQRMGDMMLTGRTVSPQQMEVWGGVSYVVEAGQALTRAIELATVAASNAAMSNYAIINALPRIRDMSSEDGLFVESLMSSLTSVTPEATERLRAFLDKRVAKLEAPKE